MTAMANPWKGLIPLTLAILLGLGVGCGWLIRGWW